jgi:predicted negative regulator of RcsB-dependent stress response
MGTLVVVLLLAVAGWIVWKLWKKPDMNNDGVVDAKG